MVWCFRWNKSIPRRAISWSSPRVCVHMCVSVDPRKRERADGGTEIRKWWKEAISIWRSAIDTEKRLAEASPFPDEFSPTRGAAAAIEN